MVRIYLVVNEENGKIYVGKTVKPLSERWSHHCFLARNDKDFYFYRAIRKYGPENFSIRQIDTAESDAEASLLERAYIGVLRSHDASCGYNSTLGGEGVRPTEETRRKMSEAQSGEKHAMWGCKHSEESKRKMSESHKGKMTGALNPMYGKHPSAETLAKLSEAHKGKQPMLGKRHSDATKQLMSEMRRGSNNSFYGRTHSKETKEKISMTRLMRKVAWG